MIKPEQMIQFDTAYQHPSGEMLVPASDGSGKLLRTGMYFEKVTQGQPRIDNMEGPRDQLVRLTPWAFATHATAVDVMQQLATYMPAGVDLTIQFADKNTQFPYSHEQRQIRAKREGRKARINAGLLASNIARTTALLDGAVKQFPRQCLEAAAAELLRELEPAKED